MSQEWWVCFLTNWKTINSTELILLSVQDANLLNLCTAFRQWGLQSKEGLSTETLCSMAYWGGILPVELLWEGSIQQPVGKVESCKGGWEENSGRLIYVTGAVDMFGYASCKVNVSSRLSLPLLAVVLVAHYAKSIPHQLYFCMLFVISSEVKMYERIMYSMPGIHWLMLHVNLRCVFKIMQRY